MMLPETLQIPLREHLKRVKAIHDRRGLAGVRSPFDAPDAIMEDFMPILIRHHDNNINLPGEVEITAFRPERMPDSPASYMALNAIFGFLYGSI